MKTFLIAPLLLLLVGCADKGAYNSYLQSFDAAADKHYMAASTPLLSVELPSPVAGQPYKIVVAREVERMQPEQIKDNEWVQPVGAFVRTLGAVGMTWIAVDGAVEVVKTFGQSSGLQVSGPNARITNSGNRASAGDYGTASAGGYNPVEQVVSGEGTSANLDQSKPSTITSDDDVITEVTRTTETHVTRDSNNQTP